MSKKGFMESFEKSRNKKTNPLNAIKLVILVLALFIFFSWSWFDDITCRQNQILENQTAIAEKLNITLPSPTKEE